MAGSGKLKVCMVCHPTQGGSGIVASELGSALASRGHEVHFVTHTLPFRLRGDEKNITFHRVDVTDYPLFRFPPYSMSLAGKLVELCREIDFDVLHIHYAIPHAISAFLCHSMLREKTPPIVATLHGTDVTVVGATHELKEITGFVLSTSDRVTTVSDFLREATRLVYSFRGQIDVLPNFVDTRRFRPDHRGAGLRLEHAKNREKLIGHMSNFRPVKRVGDVIRIFERLRQECDAKLVLIGEGAMLPEARATLRGLGLEDDVVYTGSIRDVETVLPELDVFLLPSEMESFGLAALEAMACGVPVVVSDVGGLPEVIKDGVEGFVLPMGDVEAMSAATLRLLRDEGLRRRMATAARRRAAGEFDVEVIVSRYEELYRELS